MEQLMIMAYRSEQVVIMASMCEQLMVIMANIVEHGQLPF